MCSHQRLPQEVVRLREQAEVSVYPCGNSQHASGSDGVGDFFGGLFEKHGRYHVQTAVVNDDLGFFRIGSLKSHNNRHIFDFFRQSQDPLRPCTIPVGYTVAPYNSTKDVDQNGFNGRNLSE